MVWDINPLIDVVCIVAGMEKINIHCHPTICNISYMAILFILFVWLGCKYSPSSTLTAINMYRINYMQVFWSTSHYQIVTRQQQQKRNVNKTPNTFSAPLKMARFCLSYLDHNHAFRAVWICTPIGSLYSYREVFQNCWEYVAFSGWTQESTQLTPHQILKNKRKGWYVAF